MDLYKDKKKQAEADGKEAFREKLTRRLDYLATFRSDAGKRVLAHLLEISGLFRPNIETSAKIYVQEGLRRMGIEIEAIVPELVAELRLENYHNQELYRSTWKGQEKTELEENHE